MPLDPPARICIFGDSNIASVRKALDAGLLHPAFAAAEFWGAGGPRFRDLHLREGIVVPGLEAAPVVAQVNGRGRGVLDPADFDVIVFYGARLNAAEFIAHSVQLAADSGWPSRAVQEAMARGWQENCRAYRFAAAFADRTKVWFVPASFPTDTARDYAIKGRLLVHAPAAEKTSPATRDRLWRLISQTAMADGVRIVRQPEETVVRGVFSHARYGVEGAGQCQDGGHKSPDYAALVLNAAFDALFESAAAGIAAQ
ncbi:hypothetical protein [Aestuariicoccus sp. MJ-SS9]|uniref:hypothetical protein n=1 Tax=Aestuariicoccus sp. MJ-SS9 TaxID=3079855 RepID=UPI00290ED2E6|nr:hypothetical protein [Aestuariicoccus sp. MJ-SS9]MDU8914159.1 hypothetical protein [Aestuariicoccus sp. MJ-SS9]